MKNLPDLSTIRDSICTAKKMIEIYKKQNRGYSQRKAIECLIKVAQTVLEGKNNE